MIARQSSSPRRMAPHCTPALPVRVVGPSRDDSLLDASLALAHTQLVGQLTDEASLDARTMGTLGFTGALLAADITAKSILGSAWWTPLIAIGMATLCCLSPALGIGLKSARYTDLGPDPVTFYAGFGSRRSKHAREQLLAELTAAFSKNAERLWAKRRALWSSLVILAIGLIASIVVIIIELDSPSTVRSAHARQDTQA